MQCGPVINYFLQWAPYWFLSGHLCGGSGVQVLNFLCGGVGFVYKSSDEAECLCK